MHEPVLLQDWQCFKFVLGGFRVRDMTEPEVYREIMHNTFTDTKSEQQTKEGLKNHT